jgi:hypothetical protein
LSGDIPPKTKITLSRNFHSALFTSTILISNVQSPGSVCSAGLTLYDDLSDDAEIEIASESSGTDDRSELNELCRRDRSNGRVGGARSRGSLDIKALWGRMVVAMLVRSDTWRWYS